MNNSKKIVWIVLVIMLFLQIPLNGFSESSSRKIGTVSGGSLHMRSKASTNGSVLATYPSGTKVNILSESSSWYEVEKNGLTGYMMKKYIDTGESYTHTGWGTLESDGHFVHLFASPDTQSNIVMTCLSGTRVEVCENAGNFIRVRNGTVLGYCPIENVKLSSEKQYGLSLYTDGNNLYKFNPDTQSPAREYGSEKNISVTSGDFTYDVSYPVLYLGAADADINLYVHSIIDAAKTDFQQYYQNSDNTAHLKLNYSAEIIDEQYLTILFFGDYSLNGNLLSSIVKAVTLSLDQGEETDIRQSITNPDIVLFQIEGMLISLFENYSEGYSVFTHFDSLPAPVLDQSGLSFYFAPGELLPVSMGMQKITVSYYKCADFLSLDTPIVQKNKRTLDPSRPIIALTFDDGPGDDTLRILDALEIYGGKATFCVVGNRLSSYRNVLKETVASGQEIASHTWAHKRLTELSNSKIEYQISSVNDWVRENTYGYEIRVLRPPYGSNDSKVRKVCAGLNMVIATWTIDTLDWSTRSEEKTYQNIISQAENGAIVLCHDIYSTTVDAAVRAIAELSSRGYQLVTVSELLSVYKGGAVPGTTYSHVEPDNMDFSQIQQP